MKNVTLSLRLPLLLAAMLAVGLQPLYALAGCCCTTSGKQKARCCQAKPAGNRDSNGSACTNSDQCQKPCCRVRSQHPLTAEPLALVQVAPDLAIAPSGLVGPLSPAAILRLAAIRPVFDSGGNQRQALLCVWRN